MPHKTLIRIPPLIKSFSVLSLQFFSIEAYSIIAERHKSHPKSIK